MSERMEYLIERSLTAEYCDDMPFQIESSSSDRGSVEELKAVASAKSGTLALLDLGVIKFLTVVTIVNLGIQGLLVLGMFLVLGLLVLGTFLIPDDTFLVTLLVGCCTFKTLSLVSFGRSLFERVWSGVRVCISLSPTRTLWPLGITTLRFILGVGRRLVSN